MKVAIVHDWLFGMRGGERCLEVIAAIFPDPDIYTLFYEPSGISDSIKRRPVFASFLNRLPGISGYYRHLLPLYDSGVKDLSRRIKKGRPVGAGGDFEGYDLVISISHCVAKNIIVPPSIPHVCYCLSPMRYLWDQYAAYFEGRKLEPLIRAIAGRLRKTDVSRSRGVTRFIAISSFIRDRIRRCYGTEAYVVYPPVRTDWIDAALVRDGGKQADRSRFICVNALVPYKNVHLIVEAFNRLALPLTIIGSGPEAGRLKAAAGPTIEFIERVTDEELALYYKHSKGLVFAANEDFGMVPVEVQAAGTAVIALGSGGALETVVDGGPSRTGVFFSEPTVEAIVAAVKDFMGRQSEISVDNCIRQGRSFSEDRFIDGFIAALSGVLSESQIHSLRPAAAAGSAASGLNRNVLQPETGGSVLSEDASAADASELLGDFPIRNVAG